MAVIVQKTVTKVRKSTFLQTFSSVLVLNQSYQKDFKSHQMFVLKAKFEYFLAFQPEMVYKHRLDIQDLTKNAHDMYLMGMTMACIGIPTERHDGKERKKQRAKYRFWVSIK